MKEYMQENNTMALLDTIVILQMSLESLENLQQTPFNKQKVKMLTKQLIKELEPIVEVNYNKVFGVDQETTLSIISEFERGVKSISHLNVPDKIAHCQFFEAWAKDRKTTESTIHRILNKPS